MNIDASRRLTEFVVDVLDSAAKMAVAKFGIVSTSIKDEDNNQVVTDTDIAIGAFLVEQVSIAFPNHNIIEEESGAIDRSSSYTWVIDPIDGTSNFANGVPTYGVMLGLLVGDQPVVGGIALPSYGEIIVASHGHGAYCNGQAIRVTNETALKNVLVAYGIDGQVDKPNLTRSEAVLLGEIALNTRNVRMSNSAFDSVMVAKGCYGGYLMRSSKIWDNVAQQVILEESGARYTTFNGHDICYSEPMRRVKENFTWCVAPPPLHIQLQSIIERVEVISPYIE